MLKWARWGVVWRECSYQYVAQKTRVTFQEIVKYVASGTVLELVVATFWWV